jgi:hypothetical protein
MKKTITIHSRGEAQRLLATGKVKEMRDVNGVRIGFHPDKGTVRLWTGETVAIVAPCTYEIEAPDEAPRWRVWSAKAADFPAYECSAASYYIRRGVKVHQQSLKTDRAYTVEDVMALAQADCDERNAPPKVRRRWGPWEECDQEEADKSGQGKPACLIEHKDGWDVFYVDCPAQIPVRLAETPMRAASDAEIREAWVTHGTVPSSVSKAWSEAVLWREGLK